MYMMKKAITQRGYKNLSIEHCVYILECSDGSLYTGYTNDLAKRLKMHEQGKGAKYTRGRGPLKLRFHQVFSTKQEAMQIEYRIKKLTRFQKQQIIAKQRVGAVIDIRE